jgi:hypothetical protein
MKAATALSSLLFAGSLALSWHDAQLCELIHRDNQLNQCNAARKYELLLVSELKTDAS